MIPAFGKSDLKLSGDGVDVAFQKALYLALHPSSQVDVCASSCHLSLLVPGLTHSVHSQIARTPNTMPLLHQRQLRMILAVTKQAGQPQ